MKKAKLLGILVICGAVAGALLLSSGTVSAQDPARQYNPYPPGILPPDIVSETARVRREIQGIFNQAIGEWQALTPPTLTGQPPPLQGTGYLLQSADAEQAQHPPVDSQEMGLPDTACIAFRLSLAVYRPLFEQVWGAGSFNITFPANAEQICSTPGGASVFGTNVTPLQ